MIDYIEFFSSPSYFYKYDKSNYYDFIKNQFNDYFYNDRSVVTWLSNGKKYNFTNKLVQHIPLKNWNGIAFLMDDYKTLIICNADASVRFKIQVPETLVQMEDYEKQYLLSEKTYKEIEKDYYVIKYERFDDYFEYEGKHYLTVKIGKHNENDYFDSYSQMRYLDTETGEFLPFTKTIFRSIPTQHSYTELPVNL